MTKDWGEFKIQFPDEKNTKFIVIGPGIDSHELCGSFDEATALCEKKDKQATATKREKLSLSVISEKGKKATITGIHAAHGKVLTIPPPDSRYSSDGFLPNVPWIESAIAEARRLDSRANAIRFILRGFRVSPMSGAYESFAEHKHSQWVATIKKSHADMTKLAIERGSIGDLPVAENDDD